MIHLDTSVLVDALSGPEGSAPSLRTAIESGERVLLSAVVLYEWLRGPRRAVEIAAQEALFPLQEVVGFGPAEARCAAVLYQRAPRPRRRDLDLAIAACALTHGARLWTLNPGDFEDIADLTLYRPARR